MKQHLHLISTLELGDLSESARPTIAVWREASEATKMALIWRSLVGSDATDKSHPNERLDACHKCGKVVRHMRKHVKKCDGAARAGARPAPRTGRTVGVVLADAASQTVATPQHRRRTLFNNTVELDEQSVTLAEGESSLKFHYSSW
jgi:hypothetical protein